METEMYVYSGTNEYNFEKLVDPPHYEPTRCSKCGGAIVLSDGGYSILGVKYMCGECLARGESLLPTAAIADLPRRSLRRRRNRPTDAHRARQRRRGSAAR
jgi:hypothetical protein